MHGKEVVGIYILYLLYTHAEERKFCAQLPVAPLLWNPPLLCSSFASFTASSRPSLLSVPLRIQKPWQRNHRRTALTRRLLRQPSADLPVFGIPWQFGPVLKKQELEELATSLEVIGTSYRRLEEASHFMSTEEPPGALDSLAS